MGRFIGIAAGITPPDGLAKAVHTQTEGNPLFVTEVVRLLVQEGQLAQPQPDHDVHWSVGIPAGVREVIGRRLDRLSDRCNQTLALAAVIGRQFEHGQLSQLVDDLTDERLLDVLEEALAARVIEELPATVGRYQFTHALIQDTLTEELSTTRRVRLHAQIAEALEQLYGTEAETHAAELAYHYGEPETLLGSEKFVQHSRVAGRRALMAHAYEEAIAHLERVLAIKEEQPADGETAELVFDLARAELGGRELFDLGPALDHLGRAFDYFIDAGDPKRAIEVAAHPLPPIFVPTDVPERIARALTLVTPGSLQEGRLLATAAWFAGSHEADYPKAREALELALAIAKRLDDDVLERRTLLAATQVEYWHLNWDRSREQGERAVELSVAAGDQQTEILAREWPARCALARGELDEGRLQMATAVELAEKLRARSWLATTHSMLGVVSMLEGDWAKARRANDKGLALQPREPRNLGCRAMMEFEVGDPTAGQVYLDRLLDPARRAGWGLWDQGAAALFIPLIAHRTGDTTRFDLAEAEARAALSSGAAPFMRELWPRLGLALMAVQKGDQAAAAENYAWLEEQRGILVLGPCICVDRLLGLLAGTLERHQAAVAHFNDALAFCKRAGYRPEYAWSASDYAEALLDAGSPDDREKAIELQDETLAIARELGMRPLIERVLARRDVLKA